MPKQSPWRSVFVRICHILCVMHSETLSILLISTAVEIIPIEHTAERLSRSCTDRSDEILRKFNFTWKVFTKTRLIFVSGLNQSRFSTLSKSINHQFLVCADLFWLYIQKVIVIEATL